MNGRGGTGEVEDLIHFYKERKSNIMAEKLKIGVLHQVHDVSLRPCIEIIDAEDIVAVTKKILAEMGPEEAGPSCHQYTNVVLVSHFESFLGRPEINALMI